MRSGSSSAGASRISPSGAPCCRTCHRAGRSVGLFMLSHPSHRHPDLRALAAASCAAGNDAADPGTRVMTRHGQSDLEAAHGLRPPAGKCALGTAMEGTAPGNIGKITASAHQISSRIGAIPPDRHQTGTTADGRKNPPKHKSPKRSPWSPRVPACETFVRQTMPEIRRSGTAGYETCELQAAILPAE